MSIPRIAHSYLPDISAEVLHKLREMPQQLQHFPLFIAIAAAVFSTATAAERITNG